MKSVHIGFLSRHSHVLQQIGIIAQHLGVIVLVVPASLGVAIFTRITRELPGILVLDLNDTVQSTGRWAWVGMLLVGVLREV
jgi:hypothetical protein